MSTTRGFASTLRLSWPVALSLACNDPTDPNRELHILGYAISGQANGTDSATGETLSCVFIVSEFDTGGPLLGTWTDTTTIRIIRLRSGPTQSVTYDTTLAGQQVTLTVPDSTHIQFSVSGLFTDNLSAEMLAAYPGYGQGDWTCRPDHPLDRVQPGVTLPGRWTAQPIPDLPIG
jgi:hypothetical protein